MKKKDIEQLGLLYEFMNNSYSDNPSYDDDDDSGESSGSRSGSDKDIGPYNDDFDYDNSPYKNAVYDESNPKAAAAYNRLVENLYADNVITLENFWNLFSVMYGMHPVKDAPPYKDWKRSLKHAVYKVQHDHEMPIDIDIQGHGSVYLVD